MTTSAKALGQRLKEAMAARGLSNVDVASALGVHSITVSKWRGGSQPVEPNRLPRLAEVLGVSEAWLLVGDAGTPAVSATAQAARPADLPTPARLRQLEIERELIEAGATEQQVSDFRRSVRESPLIGVLFHGGAPNRISAEAAMQLYEGVALGFRRIIEQMLADERAAKRRK